MRPPRAAHLTSRWKIATLAPDNETANAAPRVADAGVPAIVVSLRNTTSLVA